MMNYLQINRGRIVIMWGENNGENGHDGQQFEQITVQYIPGIDGETIPPGSTVIIDSGIAAVFRELLKECVVLKPDKFRDPSRKTYDVSTMLTAPDVIDHKNGLSLKNYLEGHIRRDLGAVAASLADDVSYYSNTIYWTTEPGEMRSTSKREILQWMAEWRKTLPDLTFELSTTCVTQEMAFIQYQLHIVTEEGDKVRVFGNDGKLVEDIQKAPWWNIEGQKSDLDHLRNEFVEKTNYFHKPKMYNYIDGATEPVATFDFQITEQTMEPMTVYYRFNDRHQITEIQHVMEANKIPSHSPKK